MMSAAQRLAEAEAAMHQLLLGRRSIEVVVDGRKVVYAKTDVSKIQAYIDDLNAEIAGKSSRSGAIGIRFG